MRVELTVNYSDGRSATERANVDSVQVRIDGGGLQGWSDQLDVWPNGAVLVRRGNIVVCQLPPVEPEPDPRGKR